jgi:serine/threonine protein kinase
LGIIFYEMLFGYPPWKARDEAELLRGIKTIPISHILKRNSNNLSSKATDFLKRTLAYSEEERVGWGELFELFNQKQ